MKRIIIELTDDEIWWARYGLLDPDLLADKVKDALAVPEREKGTDADIMECARAIKEYCKKYAENCEGCPFKSKKVDVWCELGCSSLPYEWNLPEGEKE